MSLLLAALPAPAQAADRRYETGPRLPATPYAYAVALPADLVRFDNTPPNNPVTDAGAALGRVLFYDRDLSANGLVSCSSCHAQASGFDDPTRFSIGLKGKITRRSAMALANARFNPRGRYFHDERAASLAAQVLQPFADPIEMALRPGELVARVKSRAWYRPLFEAAFGDDGISQDRIAAALAQVVRSIVAFHSRYDGARATNPDPLSDFPQFSAAENHGKFLFMAPRARGGAGCSACHETDAFILLRPRDNGLPLRKGHEDEGVGEVTARPEDMGKFRAASLRDIAVTGPYMHDGRFSTLDDVIDHYSTGIADKPNLAPELTGPDGQPLRPDFSDEDKAALVAFLKTLTDEKLLSDPRFSDPFRRPAK